MMSMVLIYTTILCFIVLCGFIIILVWHCFNRVLLNHFFNVFGTYCYHLQVLAAPFAAGALFLPEPWCFLSLIPSNIIGEMWVGVASATIVDLAPAVIRTSSIALYLFIITVIGGNFNIIVPPIQKLFKRSLDGSDEALKRTSLRWALFVTFPAVYVISSLLFLLAFLLMRIDKSVKQKREDNMSLNRTDKTCFAESDQDH